MFIHPKNGPSENALSYACPSELIEHQVAQSTNLLKGLSVGPLFSGSRQQYSHW